MGLATGLELYRVNECTVACAVSREHRYWSLCSLGGVLKRKELAAGPQQRPAMQWCGKKVAELGAGADSPGLFPLEDMALGGMRE